MKNNLRNLNKLTLGLIATVIFTSHPLSATELIDETKSGSGGSDSHQVSTDSEEYRKRLLQHRETKKIQRFLDTDLPTKLKR